jgi:hypothetical protein
MARYTIREFTDVVGLGKDRDSVMRSGIVLKMLVGMGLASEVGLRRGGQGRPSVVYDVKEPIVIGGTPRLSADDNAVASTSLGVGQFG